MPTSRSSVALSSLSLALGVGSCGAVFPEYATATLPAPSAMTEAGELSPPPDEVVRLGAMSAEIPLQTRDARPWDGDDGPDAYVVVFRNDTEVFRSPVARDSQRPTWDPSRDHADLHFEPGDHVRVEVRDDDALGFDLVGVADRRGIPTEARASGLWLVRLDGGATVTLSFARPPPLLGLGIRYRYLEDRVLVLAVEYASAARIAGLRVNDSITAINDRPVARMTDAEIRQALDRAARQDLALTVRHEDQSATETLAVRRDALYPSR